MQSRLRRPGPTGLSLPAFSPEALPALNQHLRRHPPGGEATEMRRQRPVRPASTCSRPNFRVHVPVAGTEQCGRPPSHQDETGRKAATEKLQQYTYTKGEPEGPTDEAPP